jgi:hypothetical protein
MSKIQFIGNFKDWIKDEWINEVMEAPGFAMPQNSLRNEARFNPWLRQFIKDINYVHTQQEYDEIKNLLDKEDENDPAVRHAKRISLTFLDPVRNTPEGAAEFDEEYRMFHDAEYHVFGNYFSLLEKFDLTFDILDDPPPFLDYKDKHITWWFSKMSPGQLIPMHIDRAKPDIEINKYWMPWTDFEYGHIFNIGETVLTDYKAGDVFKFNYAGDWHGACNIGFTNRAVLQITDYKPSRIIQ